MREAVQNCWDAKRRNVGSIRVEIGRRRARSAGTDRATRRRCSVDPPPGLPLADELSSRRWRSCTSPTSEPMGSGARRGPINQGAKRDFVDFVRNIGQPPDKDFGGGSFGYGKAAFYIASASTDDPHRHALPRCRRRLASDGSSAARSVTTSTMTGGRTPAGTGGGAWLTASLSLSPAKRPKRQRGRCRCPSGAAKPASARPIVIVAPDVAPDAEDGSDPTMAFIADTLAWNFWPRMIDTPGATKRTMNFRLVDDGVAVRIPNPRDAPTPARFCRSHGSAPRGARRRRAIS